MIAFLLVQLVALFLHLHGPTPAPHGLTVAPTAPASAVQALAPHADAGPGHRGVGAAPVVGARTVPAEAPRPAPTVAAPPPSPEDVQPQLPDEVTGRQEDGPDGSVCVVTDAELHMSCAPAPSPAP